MNPKSITIFLLLLIVASSSTTEGSSVTALFAFGDSTIDPGNNNHIMASVYRSDHPPYGRDFPNHVPTGRFSNGLLATDFIASNLGLKSLLPAYLDPTLRDNDLLTGVSFASAGSGLDPARLDNAFMYKMSDQLRFFEEAVTRIKRLVGEERTRNILNNAIFLISVGSNDLVINQIPQHLIPRMSDNSVSAYHDYLLQQLEAFIRALYNAGGRRFVVAGLPPIGCLPALVTVESFIPSINFLQRKCVDQENRDALSYNTKLQTLISRLQADHSTFQGTKIGYLDSYSLLMDMIYHPSRYGFQRTLESCCGFGIVEAGPFCNEIDPVCSDASKYIFFDAMHSTQTVNSIVAQMAQQTVIPYVLS